MTVRAMSPAHLIASCGRCRSDSSEVPTRVTRLKLSTSPPITRYGRSRSESAGLVFDGDRGTAIRLGDRL